MVDKEKPVEAERGRQHQILCSKKGGEILMENGYSFGVNNRRICKLYWICQRRDQRDYGGPARLTTASTPSHNVTSLSGEHYHDQDAECAEELLLDATQELLS